MKYGKDLGPFFIKSACNSLTYILELEKNSHKIFDSIPTPLDNRDFSIEFFRCNKPLIP